MGRPSLYKDGNVRKTLRLKPEMATKADSRTVQAALDQFFKKRRVVEILQQRDDARQDAEQLRKVARQLLEERNQLIRYRKEFQDLRRSVSQSLRNAVGKERMAAMKLGRRLIDALESVDEQISAIDAAIRGGGAA